MLKNGSQLFNNITSNDVGEYTCVARVASEQHDCSAVLNGKIISIIIGLYCGGILCMHTGGSDYISSKIHSMSFISLAERVKGKNCPGWFIKLLIIKIFFPWMPNRAVYAFEAFHAQ